MPKLPKLLSISLISLLLASLGLAAPAMANHTQTTYFEANQLLLSSKTRPATIAQLQHLGVHALRIELYWGDVAPGAASATKPSFDATNPVSYPWGEYDALVNEADRLHWSVLLTVTSPVPRWATSNKKAPYTTRPDPKDFQEFMTAVGRHFQGRVGAISIWNEPNHPAFLMPQWNSNGTPASPRIYRALYQSAVAGLQAANALSSFKLLFGETAPTGYTTVSVRHEGKAALLHDVAPLAFLRSALCLNPHYKKAGSCSELPMSGYAHHAYTLPAGPRYVLPLHDDVTLGSLSRLSAALDKAAAAHAIPAHVPIWLTEFGVQSKPNKQLGVSVAQQAEFDALSEQIAWSNSRVVAFSQYLLKDDPLGGAPGASVHGGVTGFQTGLEYVNGKPKPLYSGWPVPLVVSGRSSLWGLVRPASGVTTVTVLARLKGSKSYRTVGKATTESLGYWTLHTSVRAQYFRVRWISPEGARYEGPPIKA